MSDMLIYIDEFGLIYNTTADGGDCAHNFPIYYIALQQLGLTDDFEETPSENFLKDLKMIGYENKQLGLKPGQYVRHADPSRWYSKLKYMSRDQLKSLMTGMVYFGYNDRLNEVYKELVSRNFLHWNTEESDPPYTKKFPDPISPIQLRYFISELPQLKYLKFLLPVLDLDLLYGALYGYKRWDGGIKLFTELLAVEKSQPTFISKLASYIYKKKADGPALEAAFTVHALQVPPIGVLLRKAYEEWCEKNK
jgi:hypothetical protein